MAHPHTTSHTPRNPLTRRKRLLALFVLLATAGLAIGLVAAFNPDAFRASSKVGACHVYVCARLAGYWAWWLKGPHLHTMTPIDGFD